MTRPIALTIALAFAGPAFAADGAEPMPSDADATESLSAEKNGKKAKSSDSRSTRSAPAKARPANSAKARSHHQLPDGARNGNSDRHQRSSDDKGRQKHVSNSGTPQSNASKNRAAQQHKSASQHKSAQARSNASRAAAAKSRSHAAKSAKARKDASAHKTAVAHRQASSHKKATAHKKATSHKRASAHKRATTHKRATARARSRWAKSWGPHRGGYSRPVRWYHGVFIYGPKPVYHAHYAGSHGKKGGGANTKALPSRKVDRNGDFGVGITTGTYLSGYDEGGDFSDFGLGVSASFRPVETVGLELGYSYHNDTFDSTSERTTSLIQPSVNVYAFPWTRVSPYASLGLTWASRSYEDTWSDGFTQQTETVSSTAFGPSLGAGIEFNLAEAASLDLEAKYNGFVNVGADDPNVPGALQAGAGLTFYF